MMALRNILNSRRYYQIITCQFDLVGSKERSEILSYILKRLLTKKLFFVYGSWRGYFVSFIFGAYRSSRNGFI